MEIKQIKAKDTQDIRHRVLRPEQPEKNAIYPNDDMEGTFHLGAFEKDVLLGVASFYPEKSTVIMNPAQYRIRGVATERRMRLKGLGTALLAEGEAEIWTRGADIIWCNARIVAVGFYEKHGYRKVGKSFVIPGIGEHYLMKKVNPNKKVDQDN
ncbi:GNAT family N-acetyltransferase [Listeria monocytogenes]|uniref:GNAT family N-acetyltransferase n=1 Tax=Listeria monocytogenes TaxID=1639 RepID=UPI000F1CEB79|nr:GNAT family N-acetyltransferase [Listeria monocytogenes]EJM2940085.1 GNAT family N-acetyltransferase [Listeria monocytogenes]EKO2959243.1 GNAT family N-acetyltransferase [Listeria monocytogenes]MDC32030.1 GNAT family N-acetyltransferase [Listeria monocytogenes]